LYQRSELRKTNDGPTQLCYVGIVLVIVNPTNFLLDNKAHFLKSLSHIF